MRALAPAIAVIASVLVASGCAGSGPKQTAHYTTTPPTTSGPKPEGVMGRSPNSGTRPLVVPGSPKGLRGPRHFHSARFLSPTRLAFASIGSSNCPSVSVKLVVHGLHAIRVDLVMGTWRRTGSGRRVRVPHRPRICLEDLVISPVVIAINPKQIDVHHRLTIRLYYPKGVIRIYQRPVVLTAPPL